MARHNREASGSDQCGFEYMISYQPDWLRQIKVTRLLESGRQSTKTLFANPDPPTRAPGQQVRTMIRCAAQGLTVELAVTDPANAIRRVVIETDVDETSVQFTIEGRG
jgi:hypothetical protein